MKTFQEILRTLTEFWEKQGCIIHQGYDLEVGAGTFNPATFLRCLGPEPYRAAYVEPSRRPSDGRYGENPIRFQHYFQYQVVLKPSPANILDLYLKSLEAIGFDLSKHDIRFVHDDWESPTLGASGLGWEVWMDGMEVTQFTYFQNLGGQELNPITGEITYGIERLSTFLQGVDSTFKLQWSGDVNYGDVYQRNEFEWSHYNFTEADTEMWWRHFEDYEREAKRVIQKKFPIPAYDFVMKASHAFNMLDARGAISVSERSSYIARIRELASQVAALYVKSREEQGFPLLNKFKHVEKEEKKALEPIPEALLKGHGKGDFLLEIGVEELPATFVPIGMDGLEKGLKDLLKNHEIAYDHLEIFGTPRRLTAFVKGLSLEKPAKSLEKRGPQLAAAFNDQGEPLPPALGFFKSINMSPVKKQNLPFHIKLQNVKGVEYLVAEVKEEAVPTATLLQKLLPDLILKMDFPKKMRWGKETIAFARPIRWIVAMIDQYVLPFNISSVHSGNTSYGHRLLANHPIQISKSQNYLEELRKGYVLPKVSERKETIVKQLEQIEKETLGKAIAQEKVIPQVLHLVEWPTLTYATFDASYLKAPKEILVSEMVEHQKYFPVEDKDGNLKNIFIITSNTHPTDLIRKGNQKVLSARLYDGKFLYDQDLKSSLEDFYDKLKTVTYMKGLGTMQDKSKRLFAHAKTLLPFISADLKKVERAAHLSKVDLVTGVVYEFPELQGIMGSIYAKEGKEDPEVASAVEQHWWPKGENSPLPRNKTATILSLSDKIDNLISCFALGLKPTSSSDPYALRRQVLGMIRILIDGKYRLPLKEAISSCIDHFPKLPIDKETLLQEISQFILNRIKTVFIDLGLSKDEIEASLSSGFNDIYDTYLRVQALHAFRSQGPSFPLLYEVYKRAKGQIPNDKTLPFSNQHLQADAEKILHSTFTQVDKKVEAALKSCNYTGAYEELATLQPPLNKLFEEVKVLDDNPTLKQNRLALLQQVFGLFGKLVDFSKIQT